MLHMKASVLSLKEKTLVSLLST